MTDFLHRNSHSSIESKIYLRSAIPIIILYYNEEHWLQPTTQLMGNEIISHVYGFLGENNITCNKELIDELKIQISNINFNRSRPWEVSNDMRRLYEEMRRVNPRLNQPEDYILSISEQTYTILKTYIEIHFERETGNDQVGNFIKIVRR